MAFQSGSATADRPTRRWPQPRSAYVHVPFCRHRCGYCNFSVVADRDDLIDRYLRAIERELQPLGSPALRTLYIGGGTPTHLNHDQLKRLLTILREHFDLPSGVEWSVEANPEDVTQEQLRLLAEHGVSRISLGVQSFDDGKLRHLERGHSSELARRAIEQAASAIGNVSIDLIFAAPGETTQVWKHDLETALSLPIQHLSTYTLTYEKGTTFWGRRNRGELHSLDESVEVEMYQLARELTRQSGLVQYEISSFARAGYRCAHNLAYWEGRGWLGLGPGAARFVDGARRLNHRSTTTYLQRVEAGQDPTAESDTISPQEHARERAAFGLRMIDGIDLDEISRDVGVDLPELCAAAIDQSVEQGLAAREGSRLKLTERGILMADLVASRFLFPAS